MKKTILQMLILTFLTITLLATSCNEPIKKDLPKEKHNSKLIKNIVNGIVSRFMQDKAGNLWLGTTDNGLYKYDGKLFKQFTTKDGLDCNKISCILEDKEG
jgi:ligand-binding sensor domain-containing protein